MRKIPTLFKRDLDNMARVLPEVHPDCEWVLAGEGAATRKYDGTCVLYDPESLEWWARREVKPDKLPPAGFRAVDTDPVTGKTVGWVPIEASPFWKAFQECDYMRHTDQMATGTYELCGPKVNGNPEGFDHHTLIRHGGAQPLTDAPRDYDGLRDWLLAHGFEGIVWHHPDGRMAKLKRRDFGSSYPRREETQ